MPKTLYITIGLPNSGKSTWHRTYLDNARVLSPDDVIEERWKFQGWSPARASVAWGVCYRALGRAILEEAYRADDAEYVWDSLNLTYKDRSAILNIALGAGWNVVAIFVDTPMEICEERNEARAHKQIPTNKLKWYREQLTPPNDDEGWTDIIHVRHGEE